MPMSILQGPFHATVTLSGAAESLSSILTALGWVSGTYEPGMRAVWLQPDGANNAVIYVGGAGVTNTDFGFRLEAGATGIPPAPFSFGEMAERQLYLSEIYVLGTAAQKLHVYAIPWRR